MFSIKPWLSRNCVYNKSTPVEVWKRQKALPFPRANMLLPQGHYGQVSRTTNLPRHTGWFWFTCVFVLHGHIKTLSNMLTWNIVRSGPERMRERERVEKTEKKRCRHHRGGRDEERQISWQFPKNSESVTSSFHLRLHPSTGPADSLSLDIQLCTCLLFSSSVMASARASIWTAGLQSTMVTSLPSSCP